MLLLIASCTLPQQRFATVTLALPPSSDVAGALARLVLVTNGLLADLDVTFPAKAEAAAEPFSAATAKRDLECLAEAVYYEARSEPQEGQRAVAQVVLNRVRHIAYPGTICGVVYQGSERRTGCQFTFTCDGSLARRRERHA